MITTETLIAVTVIAIVFIAYILKDTFGNWLNGGKSIMPNEFNSFR